MPRSPRALHRLLLVFAAAPLAAQHDGVVTETARSAVDYLRDVRPILAQHCYGCHGPDANERKAELRLDRRGDAFADRDGVPAFVAGDPAASEAMLRVTSDDPDEVMPPPDAGERLTPAEIDVLRRWLAAGGEWQEHWAFVPPRRPEPPAVQDAAWPKNDVDRFVLARLEREGLRPSAEAPREAWLRRVTFDLIGLPPTPDELDAFARDTSADAFEKVVDRLLADERYGERQATEWLDVARYADSSGYQRDAPRQAWKWRDWVIAACNDNMPFDRFTIEQLAGDLLPEPTLAQRIATGFNRNHPVNTEAGEELDEYRSAYVIDRVHTTATTWLGLTVACAQCHDHKYDPISQKEFYSFYGFFNSIKEKDNGFGRNPKPAIAAPGPDDAPKLADLERRIETLEKRLEQDDPIADEGQRAWERATRERLGAEIAWTTLTPTEFMAQYGSRLSLQEDGSILASGPTPARDTYDLVFRPGKRRIEALRLEVLPDPSLPHGASGRADDGRFVLPRRASRLRSSAARGAPPLISYAVAAADVNQERDEDAHYLTAIEPGAIAGAIAVGDAKSGGFQEFDFGGRGWTIAGEARKERHEAVLVPIEPLDANDTSILRIRLEQDGSGKFRSTIGRFRISYTDDPRVRAQLVPLAKSHWRSIGPFPAASVGDAFAQPFGPESDLETPSWKKKHEQPVLPEPRAKPRPSEGDGEQPDAGRPAAGKPDGAKPQADAKPDGAKPARARTSEATPRAGAETAAPEREGPAPRADAPEARDEAADDEADDDDEDGASEKKKKKPKRLSWEEQRTWRDGRRVTIAAEGPASAHYLSRKLHTARARTAVFEFTGGEAAKVWLNGKLVGDFAPKAEAPKADAKKEKVDDAEDGLPPFLRKDRQRETSRELRVGLRAGDNHLVVKVVGKGAAPRGKERTPSKADAMGPPPGARRGAAGTPFTFALEPEGDDVLDYETLLAVRARAAEPSAGAPIATSPAEASATEAAGPSASDARTRDEKKPKQLSPAERRAKVVRAWYREHIDVAGRVLARELAKLEREKDALEAELPSALVMEELDEPRPTHVFVRGDYRQKGERVDVDTPSVLPPMPADLPRNRLGLAKWLVSGEHPLTARVTVNRAWQQFFGHGLVRTPDDFGIRGAPPTHPALLDWLATGFVASGWDVKKLHRTIVLSATYRQTGRADAATLARDPDNELLARGPHQRLSAEMIRDQALAVAGLLKQEVGGESVRPYQPPGLWKATLGGRDWRMDDGDDIYRRGLYVYWKRGVPYPSFVAFDAAKRETCSVRRTQTTTPLQALVTLNDPVYVEAGRHLGLRVLEKGGDDDAARLALGFRLVATRAPEPQELEVLTALLADLRTHYAADEKAAKLALAIDDEDKDEKREKDPGDRKAAAGRTKPEAGPSVAERAAWAQLGATLLNLEAAIRRG